MMEEDGGREALILRGVVALGRRLRAERPPGSPGLSAIAALGTLARLGPMPAVRLAELERLKPQSLTRILQGLEAQGLIRRRRGRADGREREILATAAGRRLLIRDRRCRERWLEGAMAAGLSAAERGLLERAARLMLALARSGQE